jgi:hypothetical protein
MKILDSKSSQSSLRLNMLLVTLASLPIPLALSYYVYYHTRHGIMDWAGWSLGMAAYSGFLYQMWYGKERNKKVEIDAGETAKDEPKNPD